MKKKENRSVFDGILSLADAAEIWGINDSTIRKAISSGRIVAGEDCVKYGKQWVVTVDAMAREFKGGWDPWKQHQVELQKTMQQSAVKLQDIAMEATESNQSPAAADRHKHAGEEKRLSATKTVRLNGQNYPSKISQSLLPESGLSNEFLRDVVLSRATFGCKRAWLRMSFYFFGFVQCIAGALVLLAPDPDHGQD